MAEQGGELSGRQVEVDAVEDRPLVERPCQLPELHGGTGQLLSVRRHDSTLRSTRRTALSETRPKMP
ncbi:hypothetical protein SALBM311S_04012 [Streptomyces alboniger]